MGQSLDSKVIYFYVYAITFHQAAVEKLLLMPIFFIVYWTIWLNLKLSIKHAIFLIADDFNARVGNRLDFVVNEFLHNVDMLPDVYVEDILLDRASPDNFSNENGNYLLIFCKASGMRIMNVGLATIKGLEGILA